MKKLLLLLLLLSGCYIGPAPKFNVGQCVQFTSPTQETWEKNSGRIEKILDIGHESYHTVMFYRGRFVPTSPSLDKVYFNSKRFYRAVSCPKEFNNG